MAVEEDEHVPLGLPGPRQTGPDEAMAGLEPQKAHHPLGEAVFDVQLQLLTQLLWENKN